MTGIQMRWLTAIWLGVTLTLGSGPRASAVDTLAWIATLTGAATGDQFGVAVAGAGDVNNDGYQDILVGASANDDGGDAAGKAYLFLGGSAFDTVVDWSYVGTHPAAFLGASVAGVGDVNNDGFDDILVGAPFDDEVGVKTGKALLFFGGDPTDNTPDLVFYGEASLDQFGAEVAGLGDINGDGYADWAIGAFKADSGSQDNIGKAHIYFGGMTPDSVADLTILGKADGERFGIAIAGCGRFNGDLYDDFVVGAYSYDDPSPLTNVGRAYVFFGGNPPDSVVDLFLTGENAHDFFGFAVTGAGDVNDDGFGDILVGAKGFDFGSFTDAGKVYLYLGGAAPDNTADFSDVAGLSNDDEYGRAVSGAGDLTGDGRHEFLVGADRDAGNGTESGRAYLYGGAAVPPFPLDTTLNGASGSRFGYDVAKTGTIAGNISGGFVIGAIAHAGSTGAAFVYVAVDTSSAANQSPVLDPIGSQLVDEGQNLNLGVSASDPDGDSLIMSAENVPTNATFTDHYDGTGTFDFNPDHTQSGVHNVTFIASDGIMADTDIVAITVNHVNLVPTLASIGGQAVDVGSHLDIAVTGSDPDGPPPSLLAFDLPLNATFQDHGAGSADFDFDPDDTQIGDHIVLFVADDGELADSEYVTITVADTATVPCACPCHTDPQCDGVTNVLDVVQTVSVAFRGSSPIFDPKCPYERTDMDCTGFTDVLDVVKVVNVAFRGFTPESQFCTPCP